MSEETAEKDQPQPHDRVQELVAEAASVLAEIYDPAGVLIFWSSRIKYLDGKRPCDLYRDKDEALLERLVQHLNALADGAIL